MINELYKPMMQTILAYDAWSSRAISGEEFIRRSNVANEALVRVGNAEQFERIPPACRSEEMRHSFEATQPIARAYTIAIKEMVDAYEGRQKDAMQQHYKEMANQSGRWRLAAYEVVQTLTKQKWFTPDAFAQNLTPPIYGYLSSRYMNTLMPNPDSENRVVVAQARPESNLESGDEILSLSAEGKPMVGVEDWRGLVGYLHDNKLTVATVKLLRAGAVLERRVVFFQ